MREQGESADWYKMVCDFETVFILLVEATSTTTIIMTDHKSHQYEEALTSLAKNSAMALFLILGLILGLLLMLCITVILSKISSNPNSQQETDVEKGCEDTEDEDSNNNKKV